MRKASSVLLLVALLLSCSSEKAGRGITGRYIGTQTFGIGQVSSAMVLNLKQQGSALSGSITPPFQSAEVPLMNGNIEGNSIRFDAAHGGATFHYEGVVQGDQVQGNFEPLGCVMQSSGQPCMTDSNGSFNLRKESSGLIVP